MEPLWHNRRVQRSAAFAFFFLTLTVILMWTRDSLPTMPYTDISSAGKAKLTGAGAQEEPLYNTAKPEYDAAHMPAIPTVVANPGAAIPTAASGKGAAVPAAAAAWVNPALDPTRVALIIETRPAPVLPALLVHMIGALPPQWVVKMVGTSDSFAPILKSRALQQHLKTTKLQLVNLPDYYPMTTQETVSRTLTNITFYRDFMAPAEWILMFQTDSIICAASEQSVDDWVAKNYSWVGAPWNGDVHGGNGGLSLRNVSAIVKLLETEERPEGYRQWEDMWISEKLDKSAAKGSDEVAFSVESMYYERPLGYHLRGSGTLMDAIVWRNGTRRRQIMEYCPEVKIAMGNMRLPRLDQKEEREEEAREDENVWRKAQNLPLRLSPSQSSVLAAESSSKAAHAHANATAAVVVAAVTKTASTPEQSAAANALAEAAALASAASLSPSQNSAYVAKQAEASQLLEAAAAVQSAQSTLSTQSMEGSMTAQQAPAATGEAGAGAGVVKIMEKPVDPLTAAASTAAAAPTAGAKAAATEVPVENQRPSQQGVKELEEARVKGGYQAPK